MKKNQIVWLVVGIVTAVALVAGGVTLFSRRRKVTNRKSMQTRRQRHPKEIQVDQGDETKRELRREVAIMEEADNREFDNFPR